MKIRNALLLLAPAVVLIGLASCGDTVGPRFPEDETKRKLPEDSMPSTALAPAVAPAVIAGA